MKRIAIVTLLLCTFLFAIFPGIYLFAHDNNLEDNITVEEVILGSAEVNDVIITLLGESDAFSKEGELHLEVEEICDTRLQAATKRIENEFLTGNRELTSYRLFDISPTIDGVKVQPVKPVKIAFKNLILTQDDGTQVDVCQQLQQKQAKTLADKEEAIDDVAFYHFEDETTIEPMQVLSNESDTISTMDHFSWVMCSTHGESGDEYDVGDNRQLQSYEAESNIGKDAYTLDYILQNYNVFCSGDYLGTHVVGPMVVGGQTMIHGSLGGTTQDQGSYVHTVPSYLEGYAYNEDDPSNFPRIITAHEGMPIYLGPSNFQGPFKHKVHYQPFFKTPSLAYAANKLYFPNQLYIDFTKTFPTNVSKDVTAPELAENQLTMSNLPTYETIGKPIDQREWNQNDPEGYQSKETQKFLPNGYLYGNKDGSDRGTINYYRNFDGYDINGRRVLKVAIKQSYFDAILKETNDGYGVHQAGIVEGSAEAKKRDRELGYARYYQIYKQDDGSHVVLPVEELNKMNDGRGASVKQIEEHAISKADYAFAIDTFNSQSRQNENGDNIPAVLDTIDVTLRLRPGFNFTFEKLHTGWTNTILEEHKQGQVMNVIYDYVDDTEMSNKLTIIDIEENSEQILLPRIYKSVENDSFGNNYMFSSIEKGPAFSVLWFAPYAREVYVGYKSTNVKNGTSEGNTNGSKLVGHLVVPQADVWLGGGDYNGTVVARNIDASTIGSEGHMWPFIIGTSINGIQVKGEKRVDGSSPDAKDTFYFTYQLQELNQATNTYIDTHKGVIGNQVGGGFTLTLDGNKYFDLAGEYRLIIKEMKSHDEYVEYTQAMDPEEIRQLHYDREKFAILMANHKVDKTIYRGDFTIKELQASNEPTLDVDPASSVIKWKYNPKGTNHEADFVKYEKEMISFHNFSKKPLQIEKKWYGEDGKIIEDTTQLPEVHYDIYRDASIPAGHRVSVEIYSTDNEADPARNALVNTLVLGYVDDGANISFNIFCNDTLPDVYTPARLLPSAEVLTDPSYTKILNGNAKLTAVNRVSAEYIVQDTKITASDIRSDITIKVQFKCRQLRVVPSHFDEEKYKHRYEGGYTAEGEVEVDFKDKDNNIIKVTVPKRVLRPKASFFAINYNNTDGNAKQPQYDNEWNYPNFENPELVFEDQILTNANAWENIFYDLEARDKKGNVYYYKIVEKPIKGFHTHINIPIFRLTTSTLEHPIVVTIKNTKKKHYSIVDFDMIKVNEKDEPILSSNAGFSIYQDEELTNLLHFKKASNNVYEYQTKGAETILYTQQAKLSIHGLAPNTYYLKEVQSPNGYYIEERIMKVILHDDGIIECGWIEKDGSCILREIVRDENDQLTMSYRNEQKGGIILPDTGSMNLLKIAIVGLTLIAIGLMFVCAQLIKLRREVIAKS